MLVDTTFPARLHDAVAAIPAPNVPVQAILARASQPEVTMRPRISSIAKLAISAAAVVALITFTLPLTAPGLAQTFEAKLAGLLGWTPPPPAPRSVSDAMQVHVVTLEEARSLVPFELVPPSGLPSDVVSYKIYAAPTGVYDNTKHAWHIGSISLSFVYRRAGSRFFTVNVERFDPHGGSSVPPKYIYNADETGANGLPKRYENFAWRNGDQMTSIVAEQLGAPEIAAIRAAMGGTPLSAAPRGALNSKTIVKMRVGPPGP